MHSINIITIKDQFPIPIVDDMLDELYGASYFTKLDLRVGYHHVRVNPHDIHKAAFQNYGIIARPLTNLLKKGKFDWHEEVEVAFLALKQAMIITPTLAILNFNETFTIKTDASGESIGAVLS